MIVERERGEKGRMEVRRVKWYVHEEVWREGTGDGRRIEGMVKQGRKGRGRMIYQGRERLRME